MGLFDNGVLHTISIHFKLLDGGVKWVLIEKKQARISLMSMSFYLLHSSINCFSAFSYWRGLIIILIYLWVCID